jgi:hypothetical protein
MQNDNKNLENIFLKLMQGFSRTEFSGTPVFIKHTDLNDMGFLRDMHDRYLNKAKKMGVMTEKELLDFLDKEKTWTKEEEEESSKKREEIKNLKKTVSNLIIKAQRKSMEKSIEKLEKGIRISEEKRGHLIRNTAEEYAGKKSNESFISRCFFKDEKLTERFFTDEEFEELDRSELATLYNIYNEALLEFSTDNVRQISIEPFFTSILNLFGSNVSKFFNRNHFELSYYQINVLNYAKMFLNVFKNKEIPEKIRDNAKEIMDFMQDSDKKSKRVQDSKERLNASSGYSYMGASKEDMVEAGLDVSGTKDLHDVATEEGKDGSLDMDDFIRIHEK